MNSSGRIVYNDSINIQSLCYSPGRGRWMWLFERVSEISGTLRAYAHVLRAYARALSLSRSLRAQLPTTAPELRLTPATGRRGPAPRAPRGADGGRGHKPAPPATGRAGRRTERRECALNTTGPRRWGLPLLPIPLSVLKNPAIWYASRRRWH